MEHEGKQVESGCPSACNDLGKLTDSIVKLLTIQPTP